MRGGGKSKQKNSPEEYEKRPANFPLNNRFTRRIKKSFHPDEKRSELDEHLDGE